MNDIIVNNNSIAKYDSNLSIYNDSVCGTTKYISSRIYSDVDYYAIRNTEYKSSSFYDIYDNITDELVYSIELPKIKLGKYNYLFHDYHAVNKLESDKSVFLLYCHKVFYIIKNLCDSPFVQEIETDSIDSNPGNCLYFDNKIFYTGRIGGAFPGKLIEINIETQVTYEYGAAEYLSKFILNPEKNLLLLYNTGNYSYRHLTLFDTKTKREIISNDIKDIYVIRMAFSNEFCKVYLEGDKKIIYRDLLANRDIKKIELDDLAKRMNAELNFCLDLESYYTLRYFLVDDKTGYFVFRITDKKCDYMLIYDFNKDIIFCYLDLTKSIIVPRYFIDKIKNLGFSQRSINYIENVINKKQKPYGYFEYSRSNDVPDIVYTDEKHNILSILIRKYGKNQNIFKLDIESFTISSKSIKNEIKGMTRICANENDDCAVYMPTQPDAVKDNYLLLYDLHHRKIMDKKNIMIKCFGYELKNVNKKDFHCIDFVSGRGTASGDGEYILIESKKFKSIPKDNLTLDINKDYIVKLSRDKYKLYIFSLDNLSISEHTLVLRNKCIDAKFSNEDGHLYVLYEGSKKIERFDYINSSNNDYKPEITISSDTYFIESTDKFYLGRIAESYDGRYIYYNYNSQKIENSICIIDTAENKMIYDKGVYIDGINVYITRHIDEQMRFALISEYSSDLYFIIVRPLTMERIGSICFFKDNKFIVKLYENGKESRYFYTNANDLVKVYKKLGNGEVEVLAQNDNRRKHYLSIYNNKTKVRDRILNPEKYKNDENALLGMKKSYGKLLSDFNNNCLLE